MHRNITGLRQSARLRSEQTMKRALAASHRTDASDRDVHFRAVAAEAKVSTAWLYRQEELRFRIMRSRKTLSQKAISSGAVTQDRRQASARNIIATLRFRIKTLEEKNRELTELLERAYGVIRPAIRRLSTLATVRNSAGCTGVYNSTGAQ